MLQWVKVGSFSVALRGLGPLLPFPVGTAGGAGWASGAWGSVAEPAAAVFWVFRAAGRFLGVILGFLTLGLWAAFFAAAFADAFLPRLGMGTSGGGLSPGVAQ